MPGRHAIDNETVIPMCMHSDYILYSVIQLTLHCVFINGAATVSIERGGSATPMKMQFWSLEAFCDASCLERAVGVLERLKKRTRIFFNKRRESVSSVTDGGRVVCTTPYTLIDTE